MYKKVSYYKPYKYLKHLYLYNWMETGIEPRTRLYLASKYESIGNELKKDGYRVHMQQTDGVDCTLLKELIPRKSIHESEVCRAVDSALYLYEMGIAIPRANLFISDVSDAETVRELGIGVKLRYARNLDIKVLEFTKAYINHPEDAYQLPEENPFIANQSDEGLIIYLLNHQGDFNQGDVSKVIEDLGNRIQEIPKFFRHEIKWDIPKMSEADLKTRKNKKDYDRAVELFRGVGSVRTREGLEEVANRICMNLVYYLGPSREFVELF